jgi:hypothetical protein
MSKILNNSPVHSNNQGAKPILPDGGNVVQINNEIPAFFCISLLKVEPKRIELYPIK